MAEETVESAVETQTETPAEGAAQQAQSDALATGNVQQDAAQSDTKPAEGDKNAEGKDADTGKDADPLAAYADLKVELGDGMPIDEEGLTALKEYAAKAELKPEAVQGFLDLYASRVQAQYEEQAAEVAAWADSVRADPDIGGDKLEANLAIAHKARDAFGSPELIEVLDATGLGNHPAVVKFFVNAGRAISEDTMVNGSPSTNAPRDAARTLFPSMN